MYLHHLETQHFDELTQGSKIDVQLAQLNFISLQSSAAYDYLLISDRIPRTNIGMVQNKWLQTYFHVAKGGWWCSGLDPVNKWQVMEWGCFKPNQPRYNKKGKLIKYEHPPFTPTRVFCFRITLFIFQKIVQRYNLKLPKNIEFSLDGGILGFWQWVVETNIPIIICEGAKKAASLLSQGYVTIGIPGITSGYRVLKNTQGKVACRQLIPDLVQFTITKRTIYICFDFETKPKTITAVNNAIAQLGLLFQEQMCSIQVIELPGEEKGVDEFIVAKGTRAFDNLYRQSIDLELYIAHTRPHTTLTIPPSLILNRRYLGDLPFPNSGLVGVKSAKGTGKTTAVKTLVTKVLAHHQSVLLITHRIQLGKFLCEQMGLQWGITNEEWLLNKKYPSKQNGKSAQQENVREIARKRAGEKRFEQSIKLQPRIEEAKIKELNSFKINKSCGLCVDSIWKLNPKEWEGAIIILDEVEQSLWHLLNSNTCKEKRVKVLQIFQNLISTVLTTGGLVIAQDADLSDISLEYLQGLAGIQVNPWVVTNQWKPEKGWDITFHDVPNPTPLIQQIEIDLLAGYKCYVTTDSRSGRYSCETIERYLRERLAKLRRQFPKSLVVSSRTTNKLGHEAVEFVAAINQKITEYQIVFVTPSVGTGVSIDVQHFDRVYGIFQGVIPDSEARQALARVRDNIPRIVWCAKRGIGLIGSGSKNYRLLSRWYQENQKENLALLSPLNKIDVDLPLVYDPIHLRTWAKLSARVNASITLYRQSMKEGLIADGHQIWIRSSTVHNNIVRDLRTAFLAADPNDVLTRRRLILEIVGVKNEWAKSRKKNKEINQQIQNIKYQNQIKIANLVAQAVDINDVEYEYLTAKHSLSDDENHRISKYLIKKKYCVNVTPELKLKDERGYYTQLLSHYYLTHESEYFRIRDKQEWYQNLSSGQGKVFLPDLRIYTLKIEALRTLGMVKFLEADRVFTENDSDLVLLRTTTLQCSCHIKRALGINLIRNQDKSSAIRILGRLLNLLGLKLQRTNQSYIIDSTTLDDGRKDIFTIWQKADELMLSEMKDSPRKINN
ncbi:DNA primase [Richelia intracellularis HH01]|uniref:DNA primase n=1 Tax=Richelia intracellularis HH01 TaxID=1165094 RepID=M1X031_9NOST|nr:plasmid replication protein, CyRepA1 family [Richelia intracellularis]CCH68077.1 DNA primase [Richelia intracellularis HH01]HAE05480.1 DUF3854 domain-containing protein [Richelia sp.]